MSTANPALAPEAPAPATELRQPLLWLLAILAVGLVLRYVHAKNKPDFQLEEFTTLAAVAERQGVDVGTTPTDQDPLVPVSSLGEVSNRSVIPFGISDPVPLYHDFLWGLIHVTPVSEWSLRLPSLLASLGCIVAVFFLLRRPFGTEMALVAALFVALDPIQIGASHLARPFALANLFVVLSFAALWGLMQARKTSSAVLLAVAYGLCVALIGYLNGLYLCVVAGHLGVVLYGVRSGAGPKAAAWWGAGLALAVLLLAPELGYFWRVAAFGRAHHDYLAAINDIHLPPGHNGPLQTLFWHNFVLIGGLVLVMIAGAVVRMQLQGPAEEEKPQGDTTPPAPEAPSAGSDGGIATAITTAPTMAPAATPEVKEAPPEPAMPLPENDEALRMARLWIFLPQVALMIVLMIVPGTFFTRFLTYTTLAGAIVLAYYATRDGSREVRLGVAGFVALAMLIIGFWPDLSSGSQLFSDAKAQPIMGGLRETTKSWQKDDVILMRSGLIEADFLPTYTPETRQQVERVLVAPLTLLYPDTSNKAVIPLPLSAYRNEKVRTQAGDQVDVEKFYDKQFIQQLKKYQRFWITGVAPTPPPGYPNTWGYLACVLPPLVRDLDQGDMLLARNRGEQKDPDHYITIPPNLPPDGSISGLVPKPDESRPEDLKDDDFKHAVHILKRKPKEARTDSR